MSDHGKRFEDIGLGRLIKFWPYVIAIFAAGAWHQSSEAMRIVTEKHEAKLADHEKRITQVEDAVLYLKELVEMKKREKRGLLRSARNADGD